MLVGQGLVRARAARGWLGAETRPPLPSILFDVARKNEHSVQVGRGMRATAERIDGREASVGVGSTVHSVGQGVNYLAFCVL